MAPPGFTSTPPRPRQAPPGAFGAPFTPREVHEPSSVGGPDGSGSNGAGSNGAAPPRPGTTPPTPQAWVPPVPDRTPPTAAEAFEILDAEPESPLVFRKVEPTGQIELDEPTQEHEPVPSLAKKYTTDELAVPKELVDDIEAIAAEIERETTPDASGENSRPRRRSLGSKIVTGVGWTLVVVGMVLSGTGVGIAIDGHMAADRAANVAGADLDSARAAVGSISGSRSVAAGRIDATTSKVEDAEARLEALSDELIALDGVVSDLVVLGSRRGTGFEALMPSLLSLGDVLDETVAGLVDLGIPFTSSVSASEAFAVIADRQAEARLAAEQVLDEITTDQGDGDGFGFDTILLQYPIPGYRVTGVFGICRDGCTRRHEGIDMSAPMWTPIVAIADGTVTSAGWISSGAGYGVIIDHGNGWESKYFHQPTGRLPVKAGDPIKAGDQVGWVGNTGNSAGPHLHFEIEVRGININPMRGFKYVGAADASIAAELPAVNGQPLGGPATTAMAPTAGDLLLADLLEPLVGDQAHDYEPIVGLDGPLPEMKDDLAAARSLIDDRTPQNEASQLIAGAQDQYRAALQHERELLITGGALIAAGLVVAALGVWAVRKTRGSLAATATA